MRPSFSFDRLRPLTRSATTAIVALLAVGALLSLLFPFGFLANVIHEPGRWTHPWTFLTYPLAVRLGGGLFGPFFTALLLGTAKPSAGLSGLVWHSTAIVSSSYRFESRCAPTSATCPS